MSDPSDIDLNINNYDMDDLLGLFKVTNALTDSELHRIKKIHSTMRKQDIDAKLKDVFSKGYILLDGVKNHRIYQSVINKFYIYNEKYDIEILEKLNNTEILNNALYTLLNSQNKTIKLPNLSKGLYIFQLQNKSVQLLEINN